MIVAVMAESDDDPVVEEFDVYLSKSMAENLYLFQYPVRPLNMTYDDVRNVQARIKPKQQKVELEMPLDVHSSNYDKSKGEQIALNVDGHHPGEDSYFESSLMDKQVLTSTKAVSSTSRYAVGVLKPDKELHLTPLHAIIKLHPSFNYLDKSDLRAKAELKGNDADDLGQEEEEAKTVRVRFATPNNEKARQARERSYNYIQQQLANEPWINLNYHKFGSYESELERQRLLCTKMNCDTSKLMTTSESYVNALLPETLRLAPTVVTTNQLTAISDIKKSPLIDQIRVLVTNAKVIQFQRLLECLQPKSDIANVLRLVQQVAMLVRGCWIVKSDILYPKDSSSPLTGTSAELLCRARDYIMWRYIRDNILVRSEILSILKLPEADITNMLQQMAQWKASKGWEFLYPSDDSFLSKYPDVVQRQKMLWDARYQQLIRVLRLDPKTASSPMKSPPSRVRQRRRTKSQQESFSDDTETSSIENVEKMDIETSPCKLKVASVPLKNGPITEMNNLESSTNVNMTNGPDINKFSPQIKAELLKFIQDKLTSKRCMTLNEIRDAILEVSRGISKSDLSDRFLEEYILAVGGQKLQNKWPQTTTESLFAIIKYGNHLDKFREMLIDLFSKSARIRLNTFIKKIQSSGEETPTDAEFSSIIQEYCIAKSGFYYLKGTIQPDS